MTTENETFEVAGKGYYFGPACIYTFFLVIQYVEWFGTPSVRSGYLVLSLICTMIHLFYAFMLSQDRVNFTFWTSCTMWLVSIVLTQVFAGAYPSLLFFMMGGLCLMLMYEGYARMLNLAGCTTLKENVFPRLFMKARMARGATVSTSRDEPTVPASRTMRQQGDFSTIYGMTEEKKRIKDAALAILHAYKTRSVARNGILLTGDTGNGKTELTKALAGELKLPYVEITNGLVTSQWVNETTVNLMRGLKEARAKAPCVLLIDEIDSFLCDRANVMRADSESLKLTNTFLTESVNLRSSGIILVGATNHVNKLDGAAIREGRFDFKITVNNPDAETRKLILAGALQKALGNTPIQEGAIETATRRWNGFSVVRILSVVKEIEAIHRKKPFNIIKAEDIFAALRTLQGNSGLSVDNAKGINNMLLPQDLKQDLQSIVYRMRNIQQIEEAGGSLPTGIVFYGAEPGTGKTECARSLAKDSGWAFLATTSNDLIADTGLIDKLYAQALSIRPCIIFIDEANDVLSNRGFSQHSAMTNKLLTVMDGVSSEKRDIMFVAATNYIEQIDPAVLRGGRISEKYHFEIPDCDDQAEFIRGFMQKSKATFGDDVSAPAIVKVMLDTEIKGTVANMSTLMQDAINTMIYRGVPNSAVMLKDFYRAAERQKV